MAGIPIVADLDEAIAIGDSPPKWCIIEIATHSGRLLPELHTLILEAVRKGLGIVSGLHDATSDDAEIASAARVRGVELIDLRKSKPKHELHFMGGRPLQRAGAAPRGAWRRLRARQAHHHPHHRRGNERGRGARRDDLHGSTGWMQGARDASRPTPFAAAIA